MIDKGTAITLLTKEWVDAHGLTIKEKAAEYILGANGTVVKTVGMTSMTLLLAPTLELDVLNIAICSVTSTKDCSDVIYCAGTMRPLVYL